MNRWLLLPALVALPCLSLGAKPDFLSESFKFSEASKKNRFLDGGQFSPLVETWTGDFPPEIGIASENPFPVIPNSVEGSLFISSGAFFTKARFPKGSFWFAVQLRRASPSGFFNISLMNGTSHEIITVGELHDDGVEGYVVRLAGSDRATPPKTPIPSATPVLAVVYFDAKAETATLWIDPPLTPEPPSPETAYQVTNAPNAERKDWEKPPLAAIQISAIAGTKAQIDEIRVASQWSRLW